MNKTEIVLVMLFGLILINLTAVMTLSLFAIPVMFLSYLFFLEVLDRLK